MGVRPSQWLGVEGDPWSSYCLDNAVMTFGRALEAEMAAKAAEAKDQSQASTRRMMVLGHWLDLDDSARFRSATPTTKE